MLGGSPDGAIQTNGPSNMDGNHVENKSGAKKPTPSVAVTFMGLESATVHIGLYAMQLMLVSGHTSVHFSAMTDSEAREIIEQLRGACDTWEALLKRSALAAVQHPVGEPVAGAA
jgi:hypothetical protein